MMRCLALAVAALGCAQPLPETAVEVAAGTLETAAPPRQLVPPTLRRVSLHNDVWIGRSAPPAPAPDFSGNNVLFLNFEGVTLNDSFTDDARVNDSGMGNVVVPAFKLPTGAKFTRQQGIDSIVDRIRSFYKAFDLSIVTTRPATGNYTMIAFGGRNTIVPGLSGAAGVALLDCDGSILNNVVYDFTEEQPPDYGGLPSIAITAAHESGHSYGLEHNINPIDIMYSVADPMSTIDGLFNPRFATGNYSSFNGGGEVGSCGRPDPLDNVALLTTVLGANPTPGDTSPPVVSLDFPTLQYVPTQFPIRFSASDNNKVQRVEVFKNAELVAVLTAPPYQATIEAADGESFYVILDAFDADANHKTAMRTFLAESVTPPLCPDNTCTGGRICKQGICRNPIGTECTVAQQCESVCKKPAGAPDLICTTTCNGARPCPTGFACGSDSLCAPSMGPPPKLLGEACTAAQECESMRCNNVCVPACVAGSGCAEGLSCIVVTGGEGCVTPTEPPKSDGCDMAPRSSSPAPLTLLMMLGFAFALRLRRR
jgi:hypothetical protein